MKQPISLSVFFPTYNEEKNIQETVLKTIRVIEDSPYISAYELIIINDGSTDDTQKIADKLARQFPAVRVVNHGANLGYGMALQTGIREARMDYVFFTDADLQFDIGELQNLIVHLPQYPVVIGYRAQRKDSLMRLVNAWGWNKLNRLLFGLRVRDIDCAFKVFKRDEVQSLKLKSSGAMISAETLIRLSRKRVPFKEVPVTHAPRAAGSPTGARISVIVRAFNEMIELYRGELGLATHKEALRFMSVGVINTLLDASAYVALTRGTDVFAHHLVAAKFFSFLAGTVSSLLLNRSWTFGMQGRLTVAEVVRFYAVTSLSITINVAMMNLLVGFGMYDLIALAVTTVFTFAASFTLSKFWVFKRKEKIITV
ncbi:MAG: bifunctional glycosyltransferase family 2/GtrA family protein [Patescibacteria group bacterium]|nr:bifunctional glycosyltransferase family 2/GtrA family protein [Patescibacteria group bacterium]